MFHVKQDIIQNIGSQMIKGIYIKRFMVKVKLKSSAKQNE